ncbi:MAG: hypothetical protein HPY71_06460 [Firmicutes bacterium]|nr:hypothetical protein [Bacillota bacterium]
MNASNAGTASTDTCGWTNNIGEVKGEGHRVWVVPDGDLPPRGDGELEGHESLIILNTNRENAHILIDIYFTDRDPVLGIPYTVDGQRVLCIRLDKPIGPDSYRIPFGQYALRIRSDVPVVVQFGRLDVRQPNLAYYGTMAFPVA